MALENKKFTVYLSFKNKETAEKWLKNHGITQGFTNSQIINVEVQNNDAGKTKKN